MMWGGDGGHARRYPSWFFSFILREHLWLPRRHKTNRSESSVSLPTAASWASDSAFMSLAVASFPPGKVGACATPHAPLALVT